MRRLEKLKWCTQIYWQLTVSSLESIFPNLFSSVQLLSHVWLFSTPWTAACQASLSITNSRSLLKLMSIESVMPSNHFILPPFLSRLQSFPASGYFPMSQFFASGGQNIRVSQFVVHPNSHLHKAYIQWSPENACLILNIKAFDKSYKNKVDIL